MYNGTQSEGKMFAKYIYVIYRIEEQLSSLYSELLLLKTEEIYSLETSNKTAIIASTWLFLFTILLLNYEYS